MSGALLHVRVTPRGGRDGIIGWDGETLRVRVAAAPADGAANEAVIALLARHFEVAKREIVIVRGASARDKWVRVGGLDAEALRGRAPGANGESAERGGRGSTAEAARPRARD